MLSNEIEAMYERSHVQLCKRKGRNLLAQLDV